MPLTTSQVLNNRYRIVRLLGQGGFGAVYRAWDLNLERPCALKENLDASPEAERQFKREARILAELVHPNLPRVFDSFSLPGQGQYLVMDYVEGDDLQCILERSGSPLPEAQVIAWITQVCEALAYLHSQEPPIIHRDIKPANIKLNPRGRPVLVDFGIAKVYDPKLRTTLGARAVTPGFSPIEQYGSGGRTDPRTDVYALGATLYALLTCQVPVEVPERNMGMPLPAPRSLNPLLSPHLETAILKALEILPDKRFQSAAEFKLAISANPPESHPPQLPPLESAASQPPPIRQVVTPSLHPVLEPLVKAASPSSLLLTLAEGVVIALVCIPAGSFWMGSDKAKDRQARKAEQPQFQLYLDEYHIGKYPLTNLQYQVFVRLAKHPAPPHWRGGLIPLGKEHHPVVNVSWRDAIAFCQWASQASQAKICLPSEAQWEKAARGSDGRLYPWGSWFTTQVGKYSPPGDSPYGCADMAGNIWQWTSSLYKPYPYHPDEGREDLHASGYRVQRGGSFCFDASHARSASRDWSDPAVRNDHWGFRVAILP
jgi:serine/threonine protein kinase